MKKIVFATLGALLLLGGCQTNTSTTTPAATKTPDLIGETSAAQETATPEPKSVDGPSITLIGHASVKIVTKKGKVIYVDPFYDGDYSQPADYVFITHNHSDHDIYNYVTKKDSTKKYEFDSFLENGKYKTLKLDGVTVTGVPAYNKNHLKEAGVGFIFEFDGFKVYQAGDTSYIKEMPALKKYNLDYALFPVDGIYNMDGKEATKCAKAVGAKHNIPIHSEDGMAPANEDAIKLFTPKNKVVIPYGETIKLEKK